MLDRTGPENTYQVEEVVPGVLYMDHLMTCE
jgi:hypothetical protein